MKKTILLLLIIAAAFNINNAFAQTGLVHTVAGGGTSLTDGVPATAAILNYAYGIAIDHSGNIYVSDESANVVKKIDHLTGFINTVAGTGTAGYGADGIPAISSPLNTVRGLCIDNNDNLYIADYHSGKIRKVDNVTGIITTVATGNSRCVYVDQDGNIYSSDVYAHVNKTNPVTGAVTVVAGGGASTVDGMPATNASFGATSVRNIAQDAHGNLYINDNPSGRIYKVNLSTGILNIVAGGGTSSTDGSPATSIFFRDLFGFSVDADGNMFIGDNYAEYIWRVDAATGKAYKIAGAGKGAGSSAEGISVNAAKVDPAIIHADPLNGYIYYTNFANKLRRFSYEPMVPFPWTGAGLGSDSFKVFINKQCSGPSVTLRTKSWNAGMAIITDYGDVTTDTNSVSLSANGVTGLAKTSHTYLANGSYRIRHELYYGITLVDSFSYVYNHNYCVETPVRFYNDGDGNCSKSLTEPYTIKQVLTEIDSNGIAIDTISSTCGFDYKAYGIPGDVYNFKVISIAPGFSLTCPSTGTISTTLPAVGHTSPISWFGLTCITGSTFDLSVDSYVPVTGPDDQWGHIYLGNSYCFPTLGTATLTYSPKYIYRGGAKPSPISTTANTLTWNTAPLSNTDPSPKDIYYVLWHNPATGYLTGGDTVHERFTIAPTSGDAFIADNTEIRIDTVRASCDPNAIEVAPASCYNVDTQFTFTVHFENTGNDTAFNIYVMDTLSANLDPSTLRIVMSSHNMFISKSVVSGHTIMKFDFPDINLLDSSYHGLCDGMFRYTISNKQGLPIGANIMSRVGIYFDYNDVVMTNTVKNTKGCPAPLISETVLATYNNVTLYPNPATDELTIKTANSSYTSLTISNSIGQVMMQQAISNTQTKVNVKALPAGLYYVTVKGENGNSVQKFVKL